MQTLINKQKPLEVKLLNKAQADNNLASVEIWRYTYNVQRQQKHIFYVDYRVEGTLIDRRPAEDYQNALDLHYKIILEVGKHGYIMQRIQL